MSGAQQGRGADGLQRPLLPRSRFQPQLTPGVRRRELVVIPELPNLHDACLEAFQLGPRRELSLSLVLVPGGSAATVRFGAIENFDRVSAFFAGLASRAPGAYIDRIERLGYSQALSSTAKRLHIDLDLDHAGPVSISCGKVAFGRAPAA